MSDEIKRGGKRTKKIPAPAKTALPMDQPKTTSAEALPVSTESALGRKGAYFIFQP